MKPSRILICGGRNFTDQYIVYKTLTNLKQWFAKEFIIIHGAAQGADSLAGQWAREYGYAEAKISANWKFYDNSAGSIRNKWMLLLQPDLVIAFPGGSGTSHMVELAKKNNIALSEITISEI